MSDRTKEPGGLLEGWIDETGPLQHDAACSSTPEPLALLMLAASRVAPEMSSSEANQVFSAVRASANRAAQRKAYVTWAAAAAAAILAIATALLPLRSPVPQRAARRQLLVSAEYGGKTVSLEVIVYDDAKH